MRSVRSVCARGPVRHEHLVLDEAAGAVGQAPVGHVVEQEREADVRLRVADAVVPRARPVLERVHQPCTPRLNIIGRIRRHRCDFGSPRIDAGSPWRLHVQRLLGVLDLRRPAGSAPGAGRPGRARGRRPCNRSSRPCSRSSGRLSSNRSNDVVQIAPAQRLDPQRSALDRA